MRYGKSPIELKPDYIKSVKKLTASLNGISESFAEGKQQYNEWLGERNKLKFDYSSCSSVVLRKMKIWAEKECSAHKGKSYERCCQGTGLNAINKVLRERGDL